MDVSTMLTVLMGDHFSFIISRQIIPSTNTSGDILIQIRTVRVENGRREPHHGRNGGIVIRKAKLQSKHTAYA